MPQPRTLLIDIETFPDVAYVWGVYEQSAIEVKDHWFILSYAARWLGTRPIVCRGLDDTGQKAGHPNDDRRLLLEIHALLDEADIVVAHNGIDFDIKKINARFIAQGLTPPSPYKVVDTKRTIKQVAAFSSNKLDWLCGQLGLGRKLVHVGFPLWKGCAAGDPASWRVMKRYNRHDVRLLGELYALIAPWIRQPNAALYHGDLRCVNPACGSRNLQSRGVYRAVTRTYQRYVCGDCGKWTRGVLAERQPRALATAAL